MMRIMIHLIFNQQNLKRYSDPVISRVVGLSPTSSTTQKSDPTFRPQKLSTLADVDISVRIFLKRVFREGKNMKLLKLFPLITFILFLSSCATTNTAQNIQKPEVTIKTQNLDDIKSLIVTTMANNNYLLVKDTPYLMEFQREAKGIKENMIIALAIGNSYSNNYFTMSFMLARTPEGIKVILIPGIKAEMPGGQVNRDDLLNNSKVVNECQQLLNSIKQKIENTTSTIPSSSATSHHQSY